MTDNRLKTVWLLLDSACNMMEQIELDGEIATSLHCMKIDIANKISNVYAYKGYDAFLMEEIEPYVEQAKQEIQNG